MPVQCKNCGQDNPPEARFCGNCGTSLVSLVEPPLPVTEPSHPPEPAATVAREQVTFWSKHKWLAIVPAIITVAVFAVAMPQVQPGPAVNPKREAALPPVPPPTKIAAEVGALAPDFTLSTLDGSSVTLGNSRGKPVLLNFWATWCGPCRSEMPYLQEVFEKRAAEDLVLLTVNLKEDEATIRQFMQREGYNFMVALDGDGAVGKSYQVRGIPTTLFINSAGVIQSIHVGAFTDTSQILAEFERGTTFNIPPTARISIDHEGIGD